MFKYQDVYTRYLANVWVNRDVYYQHRFLFTFDITLFGRKCCCVIFTLLCQRSLGNETSVHYCVCCRFYLTFMVISVLCQLHSPSIYTKYDIAFTGNIKCLISCVFLCTNLPDINYLDHKHQIFLLKWVWI